MADRTASAFVPKIVTTMREGYTLGRFRADAIAGATVAVVALPLAMALGIASGAPPDKGLITAIVAGFLVSALGGSRVQIGGPTGAFVVVVFNVIAQHGYDGLVLATLLAGLILIVAGYARLGDLIRFIPYTVVTGFTAGIAVIIASSQVRDFLGLRMSAVPADFLPKWSAYFGALRTVDAATVAIGVGALTVILVLRRVSPRIPGFLVAIVVASLAVVAIGLHVETIGSRFPHMPSGIAMPALPVWTIAKVQAVLPSAFTIAFLAGVEALLSAVVADGMIGSRHRSNQELVGQGVANIASALFGGLPATGAIARTATAIKAGAQTPVAGMLHAVFVLLFLLFGANLMRFVPMAALAAILFVVAWGMSEHERFLGLLRMPNGDRMVLLLTFALTVLVDLTVAIGVGVTLAALLFMARMSDTVSIDRGSEGDDEDTDQRDGLPDDVEVFRIDGPFFFGVAAGLMDAYRSLGTIPRMLIIRLERVPVLDASGAAAIGELVRRAGLAGTRVIICAARPEVIAMLDRAHVGDHDDLFIRTATYAQAIASANGKCSLRI
ncbi:SulP family inorganic anion transporter [uncultured Sphingomonas sp.]|uniref:SulP family inorganic anion transporter n=1 Tax=uncultured Sphingomonas sp. TaxID=158754 RepID=UPI0035CBAE2B